VPRRRWYLVKITTLAIGLALLGLIAGTTNAWLQRRLTAGDSTSSRWTWFTSANLALADEAVLAFALAVAFGALLRRTLAAIGAALAGFVVLLPGIRWAVMTLTPSCSRPRRQHWRQAGTRPVPAPSERRHQIPCRALAAEG
jgi:hypothetical protein